MILTLDIAINALALVAWVVGVIVETRKLNARMRQVHEITARSVAHTRAELERLRAQYERLGLAHLLK